MQIFMARPKDGQESKVLISARIPPHIKDEIDSIIAPFHGKASALIGQLIEIGLEFYIL